MNTAMTASEHEIINISDSEDEEDKLVIVSSRPKVVDLTADSPTPASAGDVVRVAPRSYQALPQKPRFCFGMLSLHVAGANMALPAGSNVQNQWCHVKYRIDIQEIPETPPILSTPY